MKPSLEYLKQRMSVDVDTGRVYWIDATKHHARLNGIEAGVSVLCGRGKRYWVIKVDSISLKRSHIIHLFSTGCWPKLQIDHINGDSLDDRASNLREVTAMQNAWNIKHMTKHQETPMGVRHLPCGGFQARITCNKTQITIGTFPTMDGAYLAYQQKRKELFGEYA